MTRSIRYSLLSRMREPLGIYSSLDRLNRKIIRKWVSAAFLIACPCAKGMATVLLK